jgi:hypothetical protein
VALSGDPYFPPTRKEYSMNEVIDVVAEAVTPETPPVEELSAASKARLAANAAKQQKRAERNLRIWQKQKKD